jgi:hypothetical protein
MSIDGLDHLLWFGAILFSGVSFITLAVASFARRQFRACLHAPLTRASGDRSEMWDEMSAFCQMSGLAFAGVSILCTVLTRMV